MQPGVVLCSPSLSVLSGLYCTHGIGRIAAPLCPMGNEFFTRRAAPYLKRPPSLGRAADVDQLEGSTRVCTIVSERPSKTDQKPI